MPNGEEYPTTYASHISPAEKKYSQTEKEFIECDFVFYYINTFEEDHSVWKLIIDL